MKLTLPNQLTLARIAVLPVFIIAFYLPLFGLNNYVLTTLYFFAGITDWFDGYLARKLEQQSEFGAFLDPVADKLLVAVALVLLVGKHDNIFITVSSVIIIGREITISALREWMANIGKTTTVAVSIIGKIKTTAQMLAIGFLLYEQPIGDFNVLQTGISLLVLSGLLTLWSMLIYLKAAWPHLTKDQ